MEHSLFTMREVALANCASAGVLAFAIHRWSVLLSALGKSDSRLGLPVYARRERNARAREIYYKALADNPSAYVLLAEKAVRDEMGIGAATDGN